MIALLYLNSLLLDYIINEGLAENYVEEILGKEYVNPWAFMHQRQEFNSFIEILKNPYINDRSKIYSIIHGNKKENIPLWLGYSYRYSLVNFIKRNTLINIDELTKKDRNFFDNYNKIFLKILMKDG